MSEEIRHARRPWKSLAAAALLTAASTAMFRPAWGQQELLDQPAQLNPRAAESILLAVTRAGNRLVAVGDAGTVLLSDDNGKSWRQAKVPVSVTLTNVYFATADDGWAVGHGAVVLHSADGGETWTKQLDGKRVAQLEMEAAKSALNQGTDAGKRRLANAQRMIEEGADKPLLDVYFADRNNGLVIGAYGLIFGTQDGGKTWQSLMGRLDNPKGKHLYRVRGVGDVFYIVGEQGALYRSADSGKQFVEIKTPYAGTYFDVVVGPNGELLTLGLRGNAYWSGDDGASWRKVDTGQPSTLTAGTRLVDGTYVITDEAGRLLRSNDAGRSFVPQAVPRPSPLTGLAQAPDGALVLTAEAGVTRISAGAKSAESSK